MREVDEALQKDELQQFLAKWGKLLLIGVLTLLAGLAAYLFLYRDRNVAASAEQGEQLTLALDQYEAGNLAAADKQAAALAKDAVPGYKAAALMLRADIALKQSKSDDAVKILASVSKDQTLPQPYRDLATVREVAIRFDQMPAGDVVARLKPLATPGSPWFGSAGEMLGVAYMKQGKNDLAGPLFAAVAKDETAPPTLRRRVRQLAGLLGKDSITDAEKTAAGTDIDGPAASPAPVAAPAQAPAQ